MSDFISREAAIEAVYCRIKQIGWEQNTLALSMRQAIRNVPAADVRPVVRGQWIKDGLTSYKCSRCGSELSFFKLANFCPNCGSDMREEQT